MSAWPQQHRLPRDTAIKCAVAMMILLFCLEGLAAYHLVVEQKDVITASLIVMGWFKEGIIAVVEHFV